MRAFDRFDTISAYNTGSVTVDVLNVDYDDELENIEVRIAVATSAAENITYSGEITAAPGGSDSFSGELFGASGSFPGDSNTHTATFDVAGADSGEVTATVSDPNTAVDTATWSGAGATSPLVGAAVIGGGFLAAGAVARRFLR